MHKVNNAVKIAPGRQVANGKFLFSESGPQVQDYEL